MSLGINVDDIVTEFGSYYKNSGQNRKDIFKKFFQKIETEQVMTRRSTENTVLELTAAEISDILQTYQPGWTPKGTTTFKPRKIELQHFKIDYSLEPYAIAGTWLDFLREKEIDPLKFPLTKYILQEFIIPKIQDNLERKELFKGVPVAPTEGTANNAGETMLGIRKQLIDGIKDGSINKVSLTALTTGTIFDKVEEFVDAIGEDYQDVPMDVCMSKGWRKAYFRDKRSEGFYQIPGADQIDESIDFTPQKVKGLASMSGEDIMWATPKWNVLSTTKNGINEGRFDIQKDKRQVNVLTDFYRGTGFIIPELVWAFVPEALLV
jgi:hypothetical protein